jgi:FAD-dependent urate hydroxylase
MTFSSCEVAVVGAGPYGLAATAQLHRAGADVRVFGRKMSFWRGMPKGMLLRSNWSATNMVERHGELSLESFKAATRAEFEQPVPLERFVEYGDWVGSRVAPDLDTRLVRRIERAGSAFRLELEDGERLAARRVVVAAGITEFAWRPPELDGLPAELASHTGEHPDLGVFRGKRVGVVGGGQSALESAALLAEAGARVEVFVRRPKITWLRGIGVKKRIGALGPVLYAPTDVGPLWYSRLVAVPGLFGLLPRRAQDRIARRSIRPAGAHWLIDRLADVPLELGRCVVAADDERGRLLVRLDDGSRRELDHLLIGTGYRVDIRRYPFVAPELLMEVRRVGGFPVLRRGLESSVPGLHFAGAPAAWSVGPIMRFVSGTWYAGRSLAAAYERASRAPSARTHGGAAEAAVAGSASSRARGR